MANRAGSCLMGHTDQLTVGQYLTHENHIIQSQKRLASNQSPSYLKKRMDSMNTYVKKELYFQHISNAENM
jgi:hypothetical protein